MVRAMCGQKVVDRKTTEEQVDLLELKETIDRLAMEWNGVNLAIFAKGTTPDKN